MFKRVFLIVMDSLGVGASPDASKFGDEGASTLGHILVMIIIICLCLKS